MLIQRVIKKMQLKKSDGKMLMEMKDFLIWGKNDLYGSISSAFT